MRYKIVDNFGTNTERLWDIIFDEAYSGSLYHHLKIRRRLVKLEERPDGSVYRVQHLTPRGSTPKFIRGLASGDIAYTEMLEYNPSTSSARVITTPSFKAGYMTTSGVFSIAPNADGSVKRTWSAVCQCSVPFIGTRIEKHIVREVRINYAKTTAFTRLWLERTAVR